MSNMDLHGVTEVHIDLDVISDEDKANVLKLIEEADHHVEVFYVHSSELKHEIETHRCENCIS